MLRDKLFWWVWILAGGLMILGGVWVFRSGAIVEGSASLVANAGPDEVVTEPHWTDPGNYAGWVWGCDSQGVIVEYQWYNQWGQIRVIEGTWSTDTNLCEGWLSINFGRDNPKPGTTRSFKLVVIDKQGNTDEDWVTYTLGEPEADPTPPASEDPRDGQGLTGISQSYELWGWGSGESYTFVAGKLDDGRWYVSSRADGPEVWGYPVSVECHQGEHWEVLITDGPEEKEREGCVGDAALGELVILTNQSGGWTISNQDISDGVVATLDRGAAQYYKFLGEQKIAE